MSVSIADEERVLILAPRGRDAAVTGQVLAQAGTGTEPCPDMAALSPPSTASDSTPAEANSAIRRGREVVGCGALAGLIPPAAGLVSSVSRRSLTGGSFTSGSTPRTRIAGRCCR